MLVLQKTDRTLDFLLPFMQNILIIYSLKFNRRIVIFNLLWVYNFILIYTKVNKIGSTILDKVCDNTNVTTA